MQARFPEARWIGVLDGPSLARLYRSADVKVFPSRTDTFGLVLIEAMACGTPVLAYPGGSVPEIVEDGLTGFIVNNEAEAVDAVRRLPELSRPGIRARFEERFTARRMAMDYLSVYRRMAESHAPRLRVVTA